MKQMFLMKRTIATIAAFTSILTSSTAHADTDIYGTAGDDLIIVSVFGDYTQVRINNSIQGFQVEGTVTIHGNGGNDRIIFRGDSNFAESTVIANDTFSTTSSIRTFEAEGFSSIQIQGHAEDDVRFTDSTANGSLTITQTRTILDNPDVQYIVMGVGTINARASGSVNSADIRATGVDELVVVDDLVILNPRETGNYRTRHLISGYESITSTRVNDFVFFDSPEDDFIGFGKRRVRWKTPFMDIIHTGDYDSVYAESKRSTVSGFDIAKFNMVECDNTRASLQRIENEYRQRRFIFSDDDKQIVLQNFEDLDVNLLPGNTTTKSKVTFNDLSIAYNFVLIDGESKSASLAGYISRIDTTGFDEVFIQGLTRQIYSSFALYDTSGDDDYYQDRELAQFTADDFKFKSLNGSLNVIASRGGNDCAVFSDSYRNVDFQGNKTFFSVSAWPDAVFENLYGSSATGFDETVVIGELGRARAFKPATGNTSVVVSPIGMAITGEDYVARAIDFSSYHITAATRRLDVVETSSYGGAFDVEYRNRNDSSVRLIKNDMELYYDSEFIDEITIAGHRYTTDSATVFIHEYIGNYGNMSSAPRITGIDNIRLVDMPKVYPIECRDLDY